MRRLAAEGRQSAARHAVPVLPQRSAMLPRQLLRMLPSCAAAARSRAAFARALRPLASAGAAAAVTTNGAPPAAPAAPRASSSSGYKLPPQEIVDIVDAPSQPALSFSPDRRSILQLLRPPSDPPIYEIARPELKLAGLRVDAESFSRSKMSYYLAMSIVSADELVPAPLERCKPITGYPEWAWLNYPSWSPEGGQVAFTVRSRGGPSDPARGPLELWVADTATGQARRLLASPQYGLNTIFDDYSWVDEHTVVACVVPQRPGGPPVKPAHPPGPKVQDNSAGRTVQNRTWPDLLKDGHDEALFDFYCESAIVTVDTRTGAVTPVGPPRLYTEVDVSPDGRFFLVSWLERPYSHMVPCGRFPKRVQLWDRAGNLVREMARLPLAEDIPIATNSCRKGPRALGWRDDKPAELAWIEAQDGGDPAVQASPRDIVYMLPADAARNGSAPTVLAKTDLRCGGVAWGNDDLALVYESWYKTRRSVCWAVSPGAPDKGAQLMFDRNYEDVYSDPGSPLSRRTAWGTYVLAKLEGKRQLLMQGIGASPEGNRPFLDVLDIDTKETRRLWQSEAPYFEAMGSLMCDSDPEAPISLDTLSLLLTRETPRDPPQTYLRTYSEGASRFTERQLTAYPHPHPQLRDMQREIIKYTRDDGVQLNATLYLPPGYDKERDGPLPCLLWAYPREYKSREAAGQMRKSPYQFAGIGSSSPTLWLTRNYAVLDGPSFPVIAEGEAEPNDTYVQQLTAAAAAAVNEVVRRGVADPGRISVGGHSYGAFMAANLLAHAPQLFAAAVARSGAYNRTLTPFGFQAEERTLWQAPETYLAMSPFMHAHVIKKPLLLVHGEEDNNTGTYPMQSERFYAALKGHGSPCRLVLLPHEGHGYRARESILHSLYETDQWLERYAGWGRIDPEYFTGEEDGAGNGSFSAD